MDNFASLDAPGDPGGVIVVELSEMKPKSADWFTVIKVIEAIEVVEAVDVIEVAEVLRSGISQLGTSRSSGFLNSDLFDVLKKYFFWVGSGYIKLNLSTFSVRGC